MDGIPAITSSAMRGGAIDGREYTNSYEAWVDSYDRGNRVFDADLDFTTDGRLVLTHAWSDNLERTDILMRDSNVFQDRNGHVQFILPMERKMSYDEFIRTKIFYIYTPMTCEDMVLFMEQHPDLYVSVDAKVDIEKVYRYLVGTASENILDRIIVNVYDEDEYSRIMEVYNFKNIVIRQHYGRVHNYYELIEFCLSHDIHVVNISRCYIDDEGVQLLLSKGIKVYVAVADYLSDMTYYHKLGVSGAVTNYLYESDMAIIQSKAEGE